MPFAFSLIANVFLGLVVIAGGVPNWRAAMLIGAAICLMIVSLIWHFTRD